MPPGRIPFLLLTALLLAALPVNLFISDLECLSGICVPIMRARQVCPYADACIREAARLVPSVHGVFRKALRDVQVGPVP
jgi:cytochrome P450